MKAGMVRAWIDKFGKTKLLDSFESLDKRMINQLEDEWVIDLDEPVNGVVNNFGWKHTR